MYFNVNFNVFFKLIIVHFLVSELYLSVVFIECCFSCLDCLTLDDGSDRLSRNFGNKPPLYAASKPPNLQILYTSRWKTEITQVSHSSYSFIVLQFHIAHIHALS